jgi:NADH dehydrogenase/NADH:ubiquinone oxidoreductase subunit G
VDKSRVRKIKSKTEWVEGDDAAPNFRGARDMGLSPGKNGFGLDMVLAGKASPEVIVISDAGFAALADDPAKVAVLRKARFLVVAARNGNALTRSADVVLPAASLSEKEGTFTNVQGRVQKFDRAYLPKPPVRAHWEHLLMLSTALGLGDRNWTPADLLGQIAEEVEGYGAIQEQEIEGGALLKKGDFAWAGTL